MVSSNFTKLGTSKVETKSELKRRNQYEKTLKEEVISYI